MSEAISVSGALIRLPSIDLSTEQEMCISLNVTVSLYELFMSLKTHCKSNVITIQHFY